MSVEPARAIAVAAAGAALTTKGRLVGYQIAAGSSAFVASTNKLTFADSPTVAATPVIVTADGAVAANTTAAPVFFGSDGLNVSNGIWVSGTFPTGAVVYVFVKN